MTDHITANPDAPCFCPKDVRRVGEGIIPQRRPLGVYLFCFACGATRVRIQHIAFKLASLTPHMVKL